MERLSWFDKVDRRLKAYGLPYGYRRRVMQELRDHAEEIVACRDDTVTDAESLLTRHLGHWKKVAEVIRDVFQQRYFAGRHPIVTFGLMPIPLSVFILFLVFWGTVGLADSVKHQWGEAAQIAYVVWIGGMACNLIPMVMIVLYLWLALRSAAGRIAVLCSTSLLALFYSILNFWMTLSNEPGTTAMSGVGLSTRPDPVKLTGSILMTCLFLYLVKSHKQRQAVI